MKEIQKINGKIKQTPEDFIVEEVREEKIFFISKDFPKNKKPDLSYLDEENKKDFLWCELEKKDIEHFRAIKEISSSLNLDVKQISYAGTKDKIAWTCQQISIENPDLEKLKEFFHEKIYLKNFKYNKRKIKLGYLDGNSFTITIRDLDKKESIKIRNKIEKSNYFPNYFGAQRFGTKNDNFNIGYSILKKDFRGAVELLIPDLNRENKISYLYKQKKYVEVLKRFDKKKLLFFINSVQSKIFNEILEKALDEGIDFTKKGCENCLLVGYKTKFYNGRLGEIEKEVLEKNKLNLEDFNLKEIPYLRLKGSFRKALSPIKNLSVELSDDEIFKNSKKIILKFTLPSGVYASTFLENFFDLEN